MHLIRTTFIILALCLLSSPVLAQTYTVSPAGSHDQDVINRAIEQAANDGSGKVYLSSGIYSISDTVIMRSNIKLSGAPDAILMVAKTDRQWFTGSTGIISCKESIKNVEISGFQINGNCINLPTWLANSPGHDKDCEKLIILHGSTGDYAQNINIHDMKLYDSFSDGMYIYFAENVHIYNMVVSNTQHEGSFWSCVNNGLLENCQIAGITSDCARLDNCQNCKVTNNIFFSYSGSHNNGAYMHGENGIQIGDAGSSHGYDAHKKPQSTNNVEVTGNTFANNGLEAIKLGSNSDNNVYIHDNKFVGQKELEQMGIPVDVFSGEYVPTNEMSERVFTSIFDFFTMNTYTQAGNNDTVCLPDGINSSPSEAIGTIEQHDLGDLSYTLVSLPVEGLSEVKYSVNGKETSHLLMLGEKQGSKMIFTSCSIWKGELDHQGNALYLDGIVKPEEIEVTCISPTDEFKPALKVEQIKNPDKLFNPILKFVFMVVFGAIGFIYLNLKFSI